jgi:SAM-dependent methyltransferase
MTDDPTLPDYVQANRRVWDGWADEYAGHGERSWATDRFTWGIWAVPEDQVRALPDVEGADVIELGCGTAYISAWLARRGARPVGVDNSPRQLDTARRLQREHGLDFPLHLGNAEAVPLPDGSFDLAISEYGASIWADPYRWIPEAARLLRPGGRLVFLVNGTLWMLTVPDVEGPARRELLRPYFGMHRFEWPDGEEVEFHLGYGDMIRLLRSSGFEIEDLKELQAPESAQEDSRYVTVDWARRWPSEQIWMARKR